MLKGPSTVTSFVCFTQGWGSLYVKAHGPAFEMFREHPALGIPNDLGVPEPPERVHWDSELARAVGVPAAYDYGPERISWLGHLMTDWIGDDGFLNRLNVQVRRHNIIGDLTVCNGTVTRKWVDDGKHFVEVRVIAENQRGEHTAIGTAVATLPSKGRVGRSTMPFGRWSDRVATGEVNGHPCLLYADRVPSLGEVLAESRRWADRVYLVQGDRRVTFGEHERAVATRGPWPVARRGSPGRPGRTVRGQQPRLGGGVPRCPEFRCRRRPHSTAGGQPMTCVTRASWCPRPSW